MRLLVLIIPLVFAGFPPIIDADLPTAAKPPVKPVKTCPVTKYDQGIYQFKCSNGTLFPAELAEFLVENPTLEITAVSPINYYDQTNSYLVVTRSK